MTSKIKIALPKGSLEEDTYVLLGKAGYTLYGKGRSYRPELNDPEIGLKILRPQEIPLLVADGSYDLGITGRDWVIETGAPVEILLSLEYGRVWLVLAVSNKCKANSLSELLDEFCLGSRRSLRIASEYLNTASRFVLSNSKYTELFGDKPPLFVTPWWSKPGNPAVRILLSFGATEAKPPEDADAILDNSKTGMTLERNDLRVIERVMESTAVLIVNKEAMQDPWKREKILDVFNLLRGVVEARKKLHIFLNVHKDDLQALLSLLPGLKSPTISPLSREGWYSVNTVVDRQEFFKLITEIRKLSQGLVVYEPRQILLLGEEGEVNDDSNPRL